MDLGEIDPFGRYADVGFVGGVAPECPGGTAGLSEFRVRRRENLKGGVFVKAVTHSTAAGKQIDDFETVHFHCLNEHLWFDEVEKNFSACRQEKGI